MRAAVAVLCIALIAGCGSSTLSTGQLRNAASTICRPASASLAQVGTPASPAGAERFLRQGIQVLAPELRKLQTLQASGQSGQELSDAVRGFAHKLSQIQEAERGLGRGEDPVSAIRTLQQQLSPTIAAENHHWQTLGIPACLSH